jgi:hypothetical protein
MTTDMTLAIYNFSVIDRLQHAVAGNGEMV